MPRVNPEILAWARETAGLSLEDAAHLISLRDARGVTGAERLAAFERGESEPTRPLLLRMVNKYHRPLLTFYLDKVPRQGDRGQDFRTAPGAEPPAYNATLDVLVRDINARQDLVKSLLEDEEALPLPFIGSANMGAGSAALADAITQTIGFDVQAFRNQETVEASFGYLRSKIEASGVFVLLIGNLGSHHSNIPPDIFRGFAIADPIAPFIIINDQDARMAWSFTAIHEVAHLWLGATGISGASMDLQIEQFCNDVAGRILLPGDEIHLLSGIRNATFDEAVELISRFSAERKISRSMVAYSLLRANIIDADRWQGLKNRFYQEWQELRAMTRERRSATEGGPSYYVVRRHRLGSALLSLVDRSISDGLLTYTKASKVLGVKPRNVLPLLRDVPQRGGL